jgi:hypothetical protein
MCIILTNSQDEKHCLSTLEKGFQMSPQNIIFFPYYNDKSQQSSHKSSVVYCMTILTKYEGRLFLNLLHAIVAEINL